MDDQRGRLLWLVDDIADLLDRIDVTYVFGIGDKDSDQATDPVIHFYEPFLAAYDNELRNKRGVYFSPRPVVAYIVRSVHELLQTEFGLEDGLASTVTWGEMREKRQDLNLPDGVMASDPFVCILDIATGTGTFLYECIEVIERTMKEKWCKELQTNDWYDPIILARWKEYVPIHLLTRLYGYELMMASYSIAHLKLAFKLGETGYQLKEFERLHVYLTNSLEESGHDQQNLDGIMPALAKESIEVNKVKINTRFTVVIGNPPYSGHSSNNGEWIAQLMRDYYFVDGIPLAEKNSKWLQDDYVKFIRLGQYIIKKTGVGLLGFISNNGFLENPTFRGMRKSLLDTFSNTYVLNLHGNMKKKEQSPDGSIDVNVFDIQQGVAVTIASRNGNISTFSIADLFGVREEKYSQLSAGTAVSGDWTTFPVMAPFYLFASRDEDLSVEYDSYVPINQAMPVHSLGIVTARDNFCLSFTREDAWKTVQDFVKMTPEKAREHYSLGPDARDWQVSLAQSDLKKSGITQKRLRQVLYRPFDLRWSYYTGHSRGFHCMPRGEVMRHIIELENIGISTTRSVEVGNFHHILCSSTIIGHHCVSLKEVNYLFPLWLAPEDGGLGMEAHANFTPIFLRNFGKKVKIEDIFSYIYTVFHCSNYRARYAEFLKSDFPRIPIPSDVELFRNLIKLGRQLVDLHAMKMFKVGKQSNIYIGTDNPKIVRIGWLDNTVWLDIPTIKSGQQMMPGTIGFREVTEQVWNFNIGGYQICHKWLDDRRKADRTLSADDISHYQKIIEAISETIRLMAEIDTVIDAHGGWPGAFQSTTGGVK